MSELEDHQRTTESLSDWVARIQGDSDQPKTTGEWTVADHCVDISPQKSINVGYVASAVAIVDAHNAALAAEQSKVRTLMDALDRIRKEDWSTVCSRLWIPEIIDTALAKVKEGK